MICKNCKYFKKGYFQHYESGPIIIDQESAYGMCLNPKVYSNYVNDWMNREFSSEPEIDGLLATCDEGRGELIIGENFGCIHFDKLIE